MKLEHAQAIVEAAQERGLEVTLYERYSGRGMYGKTTAGVVGSLGDIIEAMVATAAYMPQQDDDGILLDDFVDAMGKTSWDSMGMDKICY